MAENIDSLSIQSVNRFILAKQHLSEDSKIDDIVQITKDIGGRHATSATTPYLSLLARTNSFVKENLQKELYQEKSLAKVTFVRKTMFILPEEMPRQPSFIREESSGFGISKPLFSSIFSLMTWEVRLWTVSKQKPKR